MGTIGKKYVPNYGNEASEIYVIGEAPGGMEEVDGEPFVGPAGEKLDTVLSRYGWERSEIYLGNLSNHRPFPDNQFRVLLDSQQLKDGLGNLQQLIASRKPNLVVALGNWPLYFLTGKFGKKPGTGISNWRGSVLPCILPECQDVKVIPTYHPSYILRSRKNYPVLDMDFQFAKREWLFPEILQRKRDYVLNPTGLALQEAAHEIISAGRVTCDIETYKKPSLRMTCIGFGLSNSRAICFGNMDSHEVQSTVAEILASGVELIFHFGTFDVIVLEANGYTVKNWYGDTLVRQHVLWAELQRSLAFLASTRTYPRQNYWKHERKEGAGDTKTWGTAVKRETLWRYNCTDCCVTFESYEDQEDEMDDPYFRDTYEFEMDCVRGLAKHISTTGFYVDRKRQRLLEKINMAKWAQMQTDLNKLVGAKLNVASNPQCTRLLYDVLKLKKRWKRNDKGDQVLTADNDALIALLNETKTHMNKVSRETTKAEWMRKYLIVKLIMRIRGVRKLISSYLSVPISKDSRCRSLVKAAATDTGRWAMEKFVDGTGLNAQTLPRSPIEVEEKLMKLAEELK